MGRKGKMAVFEGSSISETGEVTPTKIGVNVCYINTYLHDFFEPILKQLNFIYDHGLYSPWVERENWLFLKVAISPKLKRSHPPKLMCMYVTSTPICMIFLRQF